MTRRAAQRVTAIALTITALLMAGNLWADGRAGGRAGGEAAGAWTVVSVVGEARVRGPEGGWHALEAGRQVETGDALRTGAFSRVVLRAGKGEARRGAASSVVLAPDSRMVVGEGTVEINRLTLGMGKLDADVKHLGPVYAFGTEGSEAVAESKAGAFSLVADGAGSLGVATHRGEVSLSARGHRVVVPAGQRAVARPGEAPGAPLAIPQEVYLEVKWPQGTSSEPRVALQGRTEGGARVRMDGREVPVSPDGRFALPVTLTEGANSVVVVAEGLGGATRREVSPPLVYEKPPPELRLKPGGSIWE